MNLINLLMSAKQGILHPLLISPEEIIKEITNILTKLPQNLKLPINIHHLTLSNIQNIIKLTIFIKDLKLIAVIEIPFVQMESFNLLKITSVPIRLHDNTFIKIMNEMSYVAINTAHKIFIKISDEMYKNLIKIEEKQFMLDTKTPLLSTFSQNCEVTLLRPTHSLPRMCKRIITVVNTTYFVEEGEENTWIFVASRTEIVTINCRSKQPINIKLLGTGRISLSPNCTANSELVTLTPVATKQSKLHSIFTDLFSLQTFPQFNSSKKFIVSDLTTTDHQKLQSYLNDSKAITQDAKRLDQMLIEINEQNRKKKL
ncbi:uncharacterized protein [Onthophagus taurus]|uniref:uncharacterized protein n=1 Tax=Onthophagus taurus TaxID=166361 RepID=UPI0039BDC729